ncbi:MULTISPECIES: helix-turn-helix transcriptional regulator [unclassified Staphylococcus]|uniref:helix-turn-helix domain-containing protein n=1 Tax=unclassified Staphylococcus TaxID=91994 RepID=UPI0021CEA24A|nr:MULTISPECIES: helix-turn-helix transcriptional regulator [unclassified Staphylococcus]UXR76399.1 helix-turn-helix transcriptional regulator [Staphylococcus sp. IVB6233]UXR80525.1 helix-turn-helix transcriptional regulator [Staphylococcus sp. IVB6218]
MELSTQIRKYRKAAGLTQEALAEKLNTTRQSVSKWEQGVLEPNFQMLNELATLFEISLDELVNGVQTKNSRERLPMNFWEFANEKWWFILIIVLVICGTFGQIFG